MTKPPPSQPLPFVFKLILGNSYLIFSKLMPLGRNMILRVIIRTFTLSNGTQPPPIGLFNSASSLYLCQERNGWQTPHGVSPLELHGSPQLPRVILLHWVILKTNDQVAKTALLELRNKMQCVCMCFDGGRLLLTVSPGNIISVTLESRKPRLESHSAYLTISYMAWESELSYTFFKSVKWEIQLEVHRCSGAHIK